MGVLPLDLIIGPYKFINVWVMDKILGANISISDLGTPFRILNIYGPYHNRRAFWDNMMGSLIMKTDHIIVGGALNFSIGHAESWGT